VIKPARCDADEGSVGLRIGLPLFAAALAADLTAKAVAVAVDPHVYYHAVDGRLGRRLVMSLLAVGFAVVCTRVAARRGLGRPWGAWIGAPLLAAGTLSNGVSTVIWTRGVPDFIQTGDWIGNLADFEIFFGIVGGILALALGVLLSYARERAQRPNQSSA
jgi:hypothetical protein